MWLLGGAISSDTVGKRTYATNVVDGYDKRVSKIIKVVVGHNGDYRDGFKIGISFSSAGE